MRKNDETNIVYIFKLILSLLNATLVKQNNSFLTYWNLNCKQKSLKSNQSTFWGNILALFSYDWNSEKCPVRS